MASAVVNRPKLTIFLSLLFSMAFFTGLYGFKFSASPREYQGLDHPMIQELIAMEEEYSRANTILVVFRAEDGSIFTPRTLETIKNFTDAAWQLPYAQRVDSITNFQYSDADGDDLIVADLVANPAAATAEELAKIRDVALSEPRLLGYLVSADGKTVAVNINFNTDLDDTVAIQTIEAEVDKLIGEALAESPQLKSYKSGYIAVGLGWLHALQFDLQYLFSSAFVIVFIGLYLFFRSLSASITVLGLGVVSMVASAGVVGFAEVNLQPPNAIGFLLILILALADSIHVVKTVRRLLAEGREKKEAIIDSVTFNFVPIIITSVTTAIGFLSFLGSEFAGFRVMGVYITFGVMLACVLSLTLLPAALVYCPLKPAMARNAPVNVNGVADWVFKLRWVFIILTVPAIVASTFIIADTPLDDNVIHYMQKNQQFRKDMIVIEENLTGSIEIMIELDSGEEQGVSDPAFMREVARFTDWLRAQPEIRYVSSYTDTMKRLNQNMHGDDADAYRLPDDKELAAQYLLLYELSLPYGLDLTNQINLDKSGTRVMMTVNDIPGSDLLAVSNRIKGWLKENAPHIKTTEPGGQIMTTTIMSLDTVSSMFWAALSSLGVICLILLFTFRAVLPGVLCAIMVISPLAVTFGVWSLAVGFFDAAATIALCMVVGIVVDNAVHFIDKFQVATRDKGMSPRDAVRYTFNTVSSALITNTLVLSGAYSMLFFSAFKTNSTMGMLTVLSLMLGLIGTFTLLPSLLILRDKEEKKGAPLGQPVSAGG